MKRSVKVIKSGCRAAKEAGFESIILIRVYRSQLTAAAHVLVRIKPTRKIVSFRKSTIPTW